MCWSINQLSISYSFRHCLRADSPSDDVRCGGNLGFAECVVFTRIAITHANILSSMRSNRPRGSIFDAAWNALLPLVNFTEEAKRNIVSHSINICTPCGTGRIRTSARLTCGRAACKCSTAELPPLGIQITFSSVKFTNSRLRWRA